MEYYKSLPLEHPGGQCYVVTAAARGHGSVVGSRGVILLDGGRMPVNDQMRFLKAGELLLQAASPVCHRLVRVVYDRIGPVLARMLFCAVLADVAYLVLKPVEWMSRAALSAVLGRRARAFVEGLYVEN